MNTARSDEQQQVIRSRGDLKLNALAGTGKTQTLVDYALERKDCKILYLAYNKNTIKDGKSRFNKAGVSNVVIETIHSLAFDQIVKRNRKYQLQQPALKPIDLASLLKVNTSRDATTNIAITKHVMRLASYFCNSNKKKLVELDYFDVLKDDDGRSFVSSYHEEIIKYTRQYLAQMHFGDIPISHDFYLKEYELLCPQLPYDIILYDEAQDASPVILSILKAQRAERILVGDSHQQIYSWRFAIDALEQVDYPALYLTKSWRFNSYIAQIANQILLWKRDIGYHVPKLIEGCGESKTVRTKATIARSNGNLLITAIEDIANAKSRIKQIYFEGKFDSYTFSDEGGSIYDVLNLYNGQTAKIKDPVIANMVNYEKLTEYAKSTEDSSLSMMINIVNEYGNELPDLISQLKVAQVDDAFKQEADMIYTNVHKSKGLEYDQVTIVDDFISDDKISRMMASGKAYSYSELIEEINLLYTAITRSKSELVLPDRYSHLILKAERNEVTLEEGHPDDVISIHPNNKQLNSKPLPAWRPWTTEEEGILKELIQKGESIEQCAESLDRTLTDILMKFATI